MDEKEEEMEYEAARCPMCRNTGVRLIANGPDDVEEEYCQCPWGEARHSIDEEK